jgi:hypothetical protein
MVVKTENFKIAEKFMINMIEKTQAAIEKHHGTFSSLRLDSKTSLILQQE